MKRITLTFFALLIACVSFALNPITGTTSVCVALTTTLANDTTGGSWTSGATSIASINASTGIVTGIAGGTANITYTFSGRRVFTVVTVIALPAISGTPNACVGLTSTLTGSPSGGTWSSSNTAKASVSSTGEVTAIASGSAVITYTAPTGCYKTIAFTCKALPNPITGTKSVCVGTTNTVLCTPTGVSWTSSNTSIATISALSGLVGGVAPGNATITYLLGSGCYSTTEVTVYPFPSVSGADSVCPGLSTTISSSYPGGTWSCSPGSTATIGASTGVLTGAASVATGAIVSTAATVTYTMTLGCKVMKTVIVTTVPAKISGSTRICMGVPITLTPNTAGGSWSSSNTAVETLDATAGIATGVATGSAYITYTIPGSGGACFTRTLSVVNPAAHALTGDSTICVGGKVHLDEFYVFGGGTLTSSDPGVAVCSTPYNWIIYGISPGTATITFTVDLTGCSSTHSVTVSNTMPDITGNTNICIGATSTLSNLSTGGKWFSSNTSVASVNYSSGVVTGVATGTSLITYRMIPGDSCMTTTVVTVAPYPSAGSISGASSACVGSTTTLTDGTTGGSWSSSNTSVASVDNTGIVTGLASGTAVISYSVTNPCSTAVATKIITVNPLPVAGSISGTDTVCYNTNISLTDAAPGGSWSSSNTSIATVNSSGLVHGIYPGTAIISYTVTNSCGTAYAVKTIVVSGCCHTSSLVINTGYSPATGSAIPGQETDGEAAVTDPKWFVSAISTDAYNAIADSFIGDTVVPVALGSCADIISDVLPFYGAGAWATNSASGWITAQNSHGYFTHGGTPFYSMTLSRKFNLDQSDVIAYDFNIANDNYIASVDIDGTSLSIADTAGYPNFNFDHFRNFPGTVLLASGLHTLNITIVNFNVPETTIYNPTGLNLYGTLASNSGAYSILSESAACSSSTACAGEGRHAGATMGSIASSGFISLFPDPNRGTFTIKGNLSGKTTGKEVRIEVVDMLGKVVYKDITAVHDNNINKNITLGNNIPNGIYLLRIKNDQVNETIRFSLDK